MRALLTPQRELLRDRGILVHRGFDLGRPVDRGAVGEGEAHGATVVGRVRLGGQPADHVLSSVGHERQDLHELVAGLAGQPHDHVVGLHLTGRRAQRSTRGDLPLIAFVVEHVGLGDVVGGEDLGLHQEEVLRVAHVGEQRLRHAREGGEHAREDLLVGADDGVGGIGHVEGHGAAVGVDHDLDRVADVIQAALGRGVRVAIGGGVGVGDPVELAARDDHVGVLVEGQERRGRVQPGDDVVADDDAAGRIDRFGEEEPDRAETHGEGEPVEGRVDGDAAAARVVGVDVAATGAARVVELGGLGVDQRVVGAQQAVVDARLGDGEVGGARGGRHVLHEKVGRAVGGDLVDRRGHDPEAVGVGQVLVDPGLRLRRQAGDVELARRQHGLAIHAVDVVPVDTDRTELVVVAQLLELVVTGQQGPWVPEPHVADGAVVGGELGGAQVAGERILGLADLVEAVGRPRGGDVVGDVGALFGLLVGAHDQRLHDRRENDPHDDQGDHPGAHAVQRPAPAPPPEGVGDEQRTQGPADDHHEAHAGQAGVNVGVAGAGNHTVAGEQQVPGLEDVARPGQREDEAEQHREVGDRLAARFDDEAHVGLSGPAPEGAAGAPEGATRRRLGLFGGLHHRALLGEHEPSHGGVDDDGGDQAGDERAHDQTVDRLPGRQREDVEAEVVMEDRVFRAEGHAVQGALEHEPLGRGAGADEDRQHHRADEAAAPQPLHGALVDVLDDVDALEGAVARRQTARDLDVGVEDGEEDGAGGHADDEPRPDLAPEDDPQADLAEPEPVGVGQQVDDEHHQGEHQSRHGDADEPTATARRRRARRLGGHLIDLRHDIIIADATALDAVYVGRGRAARPAGARLASNDATPHDLRCAARAEASNG